MTEQDLHTHANVATALFRSNSRASLRGAGLFLHSGAADHWLSAGHIMALLILSLLLVSTGGVLGQRTTYHLSVNTLPPDGEKPERVELAERRTYRSKDHLSQAADHLLFDLQEQGYLTASADSVYRRGDTVFVDLYTGTLFRWAQVFLRSDGEAVAEGSYPIRLYDGAPVLPDMTLTQYVSELNRSGYPLARATTDSMYTYHDTLVTLVTAEMGRRYVWDTLEVRGDLRIENRVLQRMLRIREGQLYDNTALIGLDQTLSLHPFMVRRASYSMVLTEAGKARVILHLDRENASSFNGVIGFGPGPEGPQGEQNLIFSGDVTLRLLNTVGRAEEMSMEWTGVQGDQQLTLLYRQPYLSFLPFGVMGRFKLFRKGELYYTLNQRAGVVVSTGPGTLFTTWVQRTASTVLDRSIYTQAVTLPAMTDYQTSLFGIEYRHQQVDLITNPGKGIRMAGEIAAGRKELIKGSDIPEALFEGIETSGRHVEGALETEFFIPMGPRWVIRPALKAATTYGLQNQENSLFLIGGINTIRGFDEQSINASSYAAGSLELRYRFEQTAHFKLFFDMAWYEKHLAHSYLSDTPYGFGAGLSLPSPAGILQVSYAWGVQLNNPLDFRTGRLHFGLDARF